jgi:hypothetical protein
MLLDLQLRHLPGGPSLMFSIVPTSIFFSVDGGHFWISVTAPKGAASSTTKEKIQKRCVEKRCWSHLRARYLPRGGPGGHYRYPEDQVPLHTSFKMRQREECASVHCHMPCGSGPCLPTKAGSNATTCPSAPDPASLLRRAPALPRVPQLWTPPPCSGGLRCCYVSLGSGPCLPAREG